MATQNIVIKRSQPLRIAEASAIAVRPGPQTVGPVFRDLVGQVLAVLRHCGIEPGICVGHYEDLRDDGGVVVHVGFEIDSSVSITESNGVAAVDLPVVEVASLVHHGSLNTLLESNKQLARWIHDSGRSVSGRSRELYLHWDKNEPANNVTELQRLIESD